METGRMGDRFYVVPFEVHDKLKELRASCRDIYYTLLRHGFIEEDWNADGEWVTGRIRITKAEILRLAGRSKSRFYQESWPQLIAAGLVIDTENDIIRLPMLKKKCDAVIHQGMISIFTSEELLEALRYNAPADDERQGNHGGDHAKGADGR